MTSSSGQTIRSGSQASSRSLPSSIATSECGLRNRTPAHTPSPPRAPTPSRCESRCVSQRSTPRRGHDDELLGERVVERRREQVAQTVGEEVGALGTMDPQGHGLQDATSCRHLEEARAGSPTREPLTLQLLISSTSSSTGPCTTAPGTRSVMGRVATGPAGTPIPPATTPAARTTRRTRCARGPSSRAPQHTWDSARPTCTPWRRGALRASGGRPTSARSRTRGVGSRRHV